MTIEDIIKKLRDMARYPTVTLPRDCEDLKKAADLLEQALAQPKATQEPVAWNGKPLTWMLVPVVPTQAMLDEMNLTGREGYDEVMGDGFSASLYGAALIAAPSQPKREWVWLTDEEITQGCEEGWVTEQAWQSAVWWAEAKLREKNTQQGEQA